MSQVLPYLYLAISGSILLSFASFMYISCFTTWLIQVLINWFDRTANHLGVLKVIAAFGSSSVVDSEHLGMQESKLPVPVTSALSCTSNSCS